MSDKAVSLMSFDLTLGVLLAKKTSLCYSM